MLSMTQAAAFPSHATAYRAQPSRAINKDPKKSYASRVIEYCIAGTTHSASAAVLNRLAANCHKRRRCRASRHALHSNRQPDDISYVFLPFITSLCPATVKDHKSASTFLHPVNFASRDV